jgi:hypothetical protein
MKYIQCIGMFVATLGLLSVSAMTQNHKPGPPPDTQEQKGKASDEDRVYSLNEVERSRGITAHGNYI